MKEVLSVLAGILVIIGYIPYILAIIRKETKPMKATWIIWLTLDTIAFAGMYIEHAVNGQITGALIGVMVVTVLALRYGTPDWTILEKFCLSFAAFGIMLMLFSSPMFGIITSCIVMVMASFPTFVSAWKDPDHEDGVAWVIFWASCGFAVIAIPHWTLADVIQPVTFLLIDSTMVFILFLRGPKGGFAL